MKIFKKIAYLSLAALFAVSCGQDDDKKQENLSSKLNGLKFSLIGGSENLKAKENEVNGHGKLIFNSPLKNDDNRYSFTLNLLDAGSLELMTNADKNLQNGVSIKFERVSKVLKVFVTANSKSIDISERFKGLDASSELFFALDVHNDESPAHVLIWDQNEHFCGSKALYNFTKKLNLYTANISKVIINICICSC